MIDYLTTMREIRPIYSNIDNDERIEPYIDETLHLFIIPALGASLYKQIEEKEDDYKDVLDGGYVNTKCGVMFIAGLKKAMAYLAYSRMLQNNQISVTTYGVDYLQSEYSQKVEEKQLTYQRNQAKEIGLKYLDEVVSYLKANGQIECTCAKRSTKRNTKITIIE